MGQIRRTCGILLEEPRTRTPWAVNSIQRARDCCLLTHHNIISPVQVTLLYRLLLYKRQIHSPWHADAYKIHAAWLWCLKLVKDYRLLAQQMRWWMITSMFGRLEHKRRVSEVLWICFTTVPGRAIHWTAWWDTFRVIDLFSSCNP